MLWLRKDSCHLVVPIVVARVARSTNNSPGAFYYPPPTHRGLLLHNRTTFVVELAVIAVEEVVEVVVVVVEYFSYFTESFSCTVGPPLAPGLGLMCIPGYPPRWCNKWPFIFLLPLFNNTILYWSIYKGSLAITTSGGPEQWWFWWNLTTCDTKPDQVDFDQVAR